MRRRVRPALGGSAPGRPSLLQETTTPATFSEFGNRLPSCFSALSFEHLSRIRPPRKLQNIHTPPGTRRALLASVSALRELVASPNLGT
jgi:hypothetical protein